MTAWVWLFWGTAFGLVQTISQSWTLKRLTAETPTAIWPALVGGMIVRWLLACVLFILALRSGLLPGLLAVAGMIFSRWLVLLSQNRF